MSHQKILLHLEAPGIDDSYPVGRAQSHEGARAVLGNSHADGLNGLGPDAGDLEADLLDDLMVGRVDDGDGPADLRGDPGCVRVACYQVDCQNRDWCLTN